MNPQEELRIQEENRVAMWKAEREREIGRLRLRRAVLVALHEVFGYRGF